MTQAYPLHWPDGWPRTPANKRQPTRFASHGRQEVRDASGRVTAYKAERRDLTVAAAMRRISDQLEWLGASDIVLSSNLEQRLDGQPRSNRPEPADCGIAVYFKRKGEPVSMACDKWNTCAGNIAAIAGHVDAIRRMERYGVGSLDRIFKGYAALPPPGHVHQREWWKVLGFAAPVTADLSDAEAAYRRLARERHPDAGGSQAQMAELNAAIADARKAFQ